MYTLWAPYLGRDSQATARRAAAYLPDSRAKHYWDLWRFGTRTFSSQLGLPPEDAWDMFTLYRPNITWEKSAPEPTAWMQNRNLDKGRPYSQEELEAELKRWF